jgi:Tuberin
VFIYVHGTGEYRLGYATNPRFSPYILIDHKLGERISGATRKDGNLARTSGDEHSLTSHGHVTHMSLSEACMAVIRCLSYERDWRVLKLVLERIPRVIALEIFY